MGPRSSTGGDLLLGGEKGGPRKEMGPDLTQGREGGCSPAGGEGVGVRHLTKSYTRGDGKGHSWGGRKVTFQ